MSKTSIALHFLEQGYSSSEIAMILNLPHFPTQALHGVSFRMHPAQMFHLLKMLDPKTRKTTT